MKIFPLLLYNAPGVEPYMVKPFIVYVEMYALAKQRSPMSHSVLQNEWQGKLMDECERAMTVYKDVRSTGLNTAKNHTTGHGPIYTQLYALQVETESGVFEHHHKVSKGFFEHVNPTANVDVQMFHQYMRAEQMQWKTTRLDALNASAGDGDEVELDDLSDDEQDNIRLSDLPDDD